MKSHDLRRGQIDILRCVYKDAYVECSVNPSPRDLLEIARRVEEEGESFLTITLPSFAKDFERSLANGRIDSNLFRGFRSMRNKRGKQRIPAFLQGIVSLLFDRTTGDLYEHPPECAHYIATLVRAVRQICRTFSKLESQCTPARERASIEEFAHIEQILQSHKVLEDDRADFIRASHLIWSNMFSDFNPDQCSPKHGPGTTSDGITGNQKYRWRSWHDRLEIYFPFIGFALPLGAADSKEFENVQYLSPEEELPSKVYLVPKTMKAPRVIAAEPLAAQYVQQALRSYLYRKIEGNQLTGSRINFRDQSVNQRLAVTSSKDGSMATLDLSNASDRVMHDLAMCMFQSNPDLLGAIESCRTLYFKLPDGSILGPSVKFASMGSALCFPVEAMYFYTICVIALLRKLELPFDTISVRKVGKRIHVYGDDIIVPANMADVVCDHLQKYLCKVNVNKSFWTGKFRESCGVEAYDGELVTPTYIRQYLPTNKHQHTEIISLVATANAFYLKGYWQTTRILLESIESVIGKLPIVDPDSPAVGRISFLSQPEGWDLPSTRKRWNEDLHRHEIRAYVVEPIYRTDKLDGYSALSKSLLSLERQVELDVTRDELHLERSARHGVAALKRRWVSV